MPIFIYYNTFMKTSYYILNTSLLPAWRLPNAKTLAIEDGQLKGRIGPQPVDTRQWPDPPHVFMANLGYDPERRASVASDKDIEMFTRLYGPLDLAQGP